MERISKIMVIDYSVPADDKDSKNLLDYFGIDMTAQENASKMSTLVTDFMKDKNSNDGATFFLKACEKGRISPSEILLYAVAGFLAPIHASRNNLQTLAELLMRQF